MSRNVAVSILSALAMLSATPAAAQRPLGVAVTGGALSLDARTWAWYRDEGSVQGMSVGVRARVPLYASLGAEVAYLFSPARTAHTAHMGCPIISCPVDPVVVRTWTEDFRVHALTLAATYSHDRGRRLTPHLSAGAGVITLAPERLRDARPARQSGRPRPGDEPAATSLDPSATITGVAWQAGLGATLRLTERAAARADALHLMQPCRAPTMGQPREGSACPQADAWLRHTALTLGLEFYHRAGR